MPNKYLFISTYSGFILCLFGYKFGYKPFIPIFDSHPLTKYYIYLEYERNTYYFKLENHVWHKMYFVTTSFHKME